jgi:hypothetical protein
MSLKKQITELETKLKALNFRIKRCDEILQKGEKAAVERQRDSIQAIVSTINILKGSIEEAKFGQGENEDDIGQWSQDIEAQVAAADQHCEKLSQFIKEIDTKEKNLELAKNHDQAMIFEKQLLDQKLEAAYKTKQLAEGTVRLPKLNITKFNGKPHDWVRFSGQFEAMVDSLNVPAITKFSHLKELVEPQIRSAIDCLPFTDEGYERAMKYLKEKYGHPSEVAGAYITNIIELPFISERDVPRLHKFYEQLLFNVESLETLGKLDTIQGATYYVVKKLEVIKAELVSHVETNWRDWSFRDLVDALRKWTEINVIVKAQKRNKETPHNPYNRAPGGRALTSRESEVKCIYCQSAEHKAISCDKVTKPSERKKILAEKHLCFNCAIGQHAASSCKSKISCQNCQMRHHTSICPSTPEVGLTATNVQPMNASVVHPVVIVQINGRKFRALLDSGASNSFISQTLVNLVGAQAVKTSTRQISTLMGTKTTKMSQFDLSLEALKGDFSLKVRATMIKKRELLQLDNPHNDKRIEAHQHLRDIELEDQPTTEKLPVHVILGANEYAKIRTSQVRIGRQGEPVAELTRFGWAIMSPGKDSDPTLGCLAVNTTLDHEQLCALDVLGLADSPSGDQDVVYQEFREQLTRNRDEGWYETALPWKGDHPPLSSYRNGSLRRLHTQVRKLRKTGKLEEYDAVIREQLDEGIVERAPDEAVGREFYMPHRAVIREGAESTKMRVVYDCSAREGDGSPSLNDCVDVGPSLQNKLWDVLVRGRFHAVALAGDLRKAFLQVRVKEKDRDALRFHWLRSIDSNEVETLRFTRAIFGLGCSPFLLGGVIEQHLAGWIDKRPESVAEISRSLYVDDLISGASDVGKCQDLKSDATEVFADASFELHKWHSNAPELEDQCANPENSEDTTYAKEQLGSTTGECKLLGLAWNKTEDTLSVVFPDEKVKPTKREVLGKLARVYDPLGLVSPMTLQGKMIFREACESKISWDAPLPAKLAKLWDSWESRLPARVSTRRSVATYREPVDAVELHAFGDASGRGVATAVYAVVSQTSGVTQGLIAAKSRLAKQGLTIPRLELVAGHMAANAVDNVRRALEGFPVTATYCWLDSTVALHWIRGGGEYRQFVANRVRKIQEHKIDAWMYVPTAQNPADLGSRGGSVEGSELWWNGPQWLSDHDLWPANLVTTDSPESAAEAKVIREVIAVTSVAEPDEFDNLLAKYRLKKSLRVCVWVSRFVRSCRGDKRLGPITATEMEEQLKWWIRRVQQRARASGRFLEEQLQLNLQENDDKILECRGRIQGSYPLYIPDECELATKLVEKAHCTTLHGGIGLTVASIREEYWIPRLRRLTKRVIKSCSGCKRFLARALASPPPGLLPKERTQGTTAFEVVGVDFAGPIRYRRKKTQEGKSYLVLFACSLSRALHLELLLSLETAEFLGALKRFIARRGRPTKIYSDNGKTFVAAAKWLKKIMQDEQLHDFLADKRISWQFNLSRAPWWGGQFERLVGLFKRSFYKTIGAGLLTYAELCEVVLNVEVELNNRPLDYVDDDLQLPILTPASFLFQRSNRIPELEPHREEVDLRKRAKYLRSCKDALWKRWSSEYLTALRERHRCDRNRKSLKLSVGDVVIVRSDDRNRAKWPLGIVERLIPGKDGVVRAVKLRAGKSYLERPVQHLYPLELSCDRSQTTPKDLNPEAPPFRPKRDAAVAAKLRSEEVLQNEQEL